MEAIYITPKEASVRYSICRQKIYELIAMPESPKTLKIGHSRLIPVKEWDKFIEETFSEA